MLKKSGDIAPAMWSKIWALPSPLARTNVGYASTEVQFKREKQPSIEPRSKMLITMAKNSFLRKPIVVSMNMKTDAPAAT
mmetsp:Transcript_20154/g.42759  ORF Transcript_20154/g.42759 Transcript_20154/m.42759 type:complete len:80 (+) Transcript_20154:198-437(+)